MKASTALGGTLLSEEECHFAPFRENIIGNDEYFESPVGLTRILYADWTASGRLYRPIEEKIMNVFGPYMANTHTETSVTGTYMTLAYHKAREIIKHHVNASENDVLIAFGSGMTGVVNKFQRLLGLRLAGELKKYINLPDNERPVVFITQMEHHSNHTSWLETIADVECIGMTDQGRVNLDDLELLLEKYKNRDKKYASVTACSNVTGIHTPYHEIAAIMHRNGGYCFVDLACSAPYVEINMHPENEQEMLDAIFFSPHKFLGGPGTPGIMIFNSEMYNNVVPDQPGGGTVKWTNPWKEYRYIDNIEDREDGGTPPILQTIKAALAVKLKEEMGVKNIRAREKEIVEFLFDEFSKIKGLHILADNIRDRLAVFSFYIEGLHYNLGVKLLNDKFGIQVRGGCSCAGTYGHYLLHVSKDLSHEITCEIDHGNLSLKPGWIRLSVHPVATQTELEFITSAVKDLSENFTEWSKDYEYSPLSNEFHHKTFKSKDKELVDSWFED
jgi:selenocysteine lyase/cysteine desulfurase